MAKQSPFLRMEEFLNNNYDFCRNVVLNKVARVWRDEPIYLDDCAINGIWVELLRGRMDISKTMLLSYLFSNQISSFDPFQSYFEELAPWQPDQPDYIQMLADTITVPEGHREQWNRYLRRWLIAAVGCAVDPKITNQQVLVLVGEQGVGKTKWTEKLVPEKLKEYYYSGDVNPGDKDSSVNLAECFLINLDELGNLNKGDLNSLKQLITQSSIRVRRPYAAIHEKMPRRASFIGSVNNPEFLRDDTGNRRYLCAEALTIDYAHDINMDLVYAQAYYLLTHNEKYWFDGEEVKDINTFNKQYKVQYVELEYVNEFFEPCSRDEEGAVEMTLTQIQQYLRDHGENILNVSNRMLGIAMKASDYVRVKKNGGTYYYKLKAKAKPKPKQGK